MDTPYIVVEPAHSTTACGLLAGSSDAFLANRLVTIRLAGNEKALLPLRDKQGHDILRHDPDAYPIGPLAGRC